MHVHPGASYGMRAAFMCRSFMFTDSVLKQKKQGRHPVFDEDFRDNWNFAFSKTIAEGLAYGAKGYHLLGGEAVNLMQHAVSDEHGAPLPGALKVARFSFYPHNGGAAGDITKTSKPFAVAIRLNPLGSMALSLSCIATTNMITKRCGSRLKARPEPQSFETLKDFPLGTIQYAGGGTERCWKREHWN